MCILISRTSSFLKLLQSALCATKATIAYLNDNCITDLELWLDLINKATKSTSILKLISGMPTTIFFTDTSSQGLGGYSLYNIRSQNFVLINRIFNYTTINHLEFFALLLQLLLSESKNLLDNECILAWLDNTVVVSQIKKQTRSDKFANQLFQIFRLILLYNNFSLWGYHLIRDLNFVADELSYAVRILLKILLENIIHKSSSYNSI